MNDPKQPRASQRASEVRAFDPDDKKYELTVFSSEDLTAFIDTYVYKGFNRAKVREAAAKAMNDKAITIVAAASALRGPKKAAQLAKSPMPASGNQGNELLTYAKILAAYPERAALVLKRIPNLAKRVPSSPVPAHLQFPSAASLDLDKIRPGLARDHKEWARMFSQLLPSKNFREDLYDLTASDRLVISDADLAALKATD